MALASAAQDPAHPAHEFFQRHYERVMAEMIDLKKEKNFFETRVIEYQTGGALSWD